MPIVFPPNATDGTGRLIAVAQFGAALINVSTPLHDALSMTMAAGTNVLNDTNGPLSGELWHITRLGMVYNGTITNVTAYFRLNSTGTPWIHYIPTFQNGVPQFVAAEVWLENGVAVNVQVLNATLNDTIGFFVFGHKMKVG